MSNEHHIPNDLSLLQAMTNDANDQLLIYRPGKYWINKTKNSFNQIKRYGLDDFRGAFSGVGTSFTDNHYCDVRTNLDWGLRKVLKFTLEKMYPFAPIFNQQVNLTRHYAGEVVRLKSQLLNEHPRIKKLIESYIIPFSIAGGCINYAEINGEKISTHYLDLLDEHDHVSSEVDFRQARSFFEIGGGFGVNLHLLIENYKNLKKFVYLDIPPNLYTGTQYLKSFYGDAVRDYKSTRSLEKISFLDNDDLEVICISPWQIEKLDLSVDIFYNAHSFVEMPKDIVTNYLNKVSKLQNFEKTKVILISYDHFVENTTLNPETLPNLLGDGRKFNKKKYTTAAENNDCICFSS